LTANQLIDGRLSLGVGLSHKPVIEAMFEIPFDHPLRDMSEYLDVLVPALQQKPIDAHGASVSYHGEMDVPGAPAPAVLLAALGPQMLRLCGARSAGTITLFAGPSTLADFIIPTLHRAAEQAGRATPRVVVLIGVWITDDPVAARAQLAERLA